MNTERTDDIYTIDFFNLGRFEIKAIVTGVTPLEVGHDYTLESFDCYYDGQLVGEIGYNFQGFIEWLGLRGLNVFEAIADELEHQEYAMRDYYSMPYDEASNY